MRTLELHSRELSHSAYPCRVLAASRGVPGASGHKGGGFERFDVTLPDVDGDGDLGVRLGTNASGPRIFGRQQSRRFSGMDFSAVVEEVTGAAAALGTICPGNYVVAINGNDTTQLSHAVTADMLRDATRPVTLTLLSTLSPLDIAKSEFNTRLLQEWDLERLVHWVVRGDHDDRVEWVQGGDGHRHCATQSKAPQCPRHSGCV